MNKCENISNFSNYYYDISRQNYLSARLYNNFNNYYQTEESDVPNLCLK
jgi:hypothetical protein